MKTRYAVALTLLAGVGLGAATVQAIHAQAKPPVYLIFENELTNRDGYTKEYLPNAVATIKAHGGRILAAGKATSLAGDPPKDTVGIVAWDNRDQFEGWFNSPEYREARAVGEKYAKYRNLLIEGR